MLKKVETLKTRQQTIKTSKAEITQKQAELSKLEEQLLKQIIVLKKIDDINKVKIIYILKIYKIKKTDFKNIQKKKIKQLINITHYYPNIMN